MAGIVGAVIAVGIGAVVAYADTINADGDVLKPNNNISYTDSASFTQHCSDRGTPPVDRPCPAARPRFT